MLDGRLDARDVTAIAATVAALAAVAVAVWDNVQQRRFYRVSVMPRLDYIPEKRGSEAGAVSLTNEGTGPAEIREVRIGLCGAAGSATYGSWNEARTSIAELGLSVTAYHDLRRGEVVGTGQTVAWLELEARGPPGPADDPVQRFIDAVGFVIDYASIYDEGFRLARRPECVGAAPASEP